MSIKGYFEIAIEGIGADVIASKLDKLGLKVLPYSIRDVGESAYDRNHIMCISLFPYTDALRSVVGRLNTLYSIEGVKRINILHLTYEKEKKRWYEHFMIPLLIATAVDSLTGLGILLGVNANLDLKIYVLVLLIPAITSFFTSVLYIHYKRIH